MPAAPSDDPPLRLRPEIGELVRLVAYIDVYALRIDMPHADCHAFMLAAEELFANTLSHGQRRATQIEFSLASDEKSALATYSDDAPAFDPTSVPVADPTLPLEQRTVGGLGIHFIRRTMSTFRYERLEGRNVITFGRALRTAISKP